jgi:diaminopimelate epimerase
MNFTKMQGTGNDFIVINCLEERVSNPSKLARKICDRHLGVGADGLLLLQPSRVADFKMRIFNPDGSQAETCGNGLRCLTKYLYENRLTTKNEISIETKSGITLIKLFTRSGQVQKIKVNMGKPKSIKRNIFIYANGENILETYNVTLHHKKLYLNIVNVGNPHCVLIVPSVERFCLEKTAKVLETLPIFPQHINVEIIEIAGRDIVKQRTWERGVGETLACGSGAAAVTLVSNLKQLTKVKIKIILKGGILYGEYLDGNIYITGNATKVYEGIL